MLKPIFLLVDETTGKPIEFSDNPEDPRMIAQSMDERAVVELDTDAVERIIALSVGVHLP